MKIYLAAPYACRTALLEHRAQLESIGHTVTSTWLNATTAITPAHLGASLASDDDYAKEHVAQDIFDVQRSDLLILFTWSASCLMLESDGHPGPNSGGRHVETGVALASGVKVLVVGEKENIFHRGRGVVHLDTWQDALDVMTTLAATQDPSLF